MTSIAIVSAALLSLLPVAAAEETAPATDKTPPFLADYSAGALGGALVGREDVWSAALGYTWSRRSDIGVVHTSTRTQLALAGNEHGIGGFGEAGFVVGGVIMRDRPWGLVFAGGPAFELSFLPGTSGHLGLNVLSLAQLERRVDGLAKGASFSLVVSIPTTYGTDDRRDPWITANVGFNTPTKLTLAKASRRTAKKANAGGGGGGGGGVPTVAATTAPSAEVAVTAPPRERHVNLNETKCEFDFSRPILFGDNSVVPLPESEDLLDDVAALIGEHPAIALVRLEGHTDTRGSSSYNRNLAAWRVEAVIDALVRRGVARERLTGVGFGEDAPVVPNARTEEQHAQNRRVLFRVVRGLQCVAE